MAKLTISPEVANPVVSKLIPPIRLARELEALAIVALIFEGIVRASDEEAAVNCSDKVTIEALVARVLVSKLIAPINRAKELDELRILALRVEYNELEALPIVVVNTC